MNGCLRLVGLVGLVFAIAVAAAEQKADFEALDKNADGKVSLNEATTHDDLFVAFKDLDANRDGELTREEFERYRNKPIA